MMQEDYVSFEVAKLLKEKGFNEKVISYYDTEGQGYFISPRKCNIGTGSVYAAPTQAMAMKWLREVYNINIDIVSIWNKIRWEYQIIIITPQTAAKPYIHKTIYKEHEQACETAIKYCLENFI